MSSGRFDYTVEERSVLLGQFSDVMKYAHEQIRPAARISMALQAAISDDDIVVVPKVTQTANDKLFHVTSDPKVRSAAGAINGLDCKVKWGLAETPDKIPMIIQPVDEQVRAVPLGKVMTAEEIYFSFPKSTTPAGWAAFGTKFPEEQRKESHIVIWLFNGLFFYGHLNVYDGKRYVSVDPCIPGLKFVSICCVLVRE